MEFDFSQPAGEPALAPAGGVSWRVFDNPISLFIGGVAAVLLELAEPSVRTGVWEYSSFKRDPGMRLRRTGFAAMMTVYGPREEAKKMIAKVVQAHSRVKGVTPEGISYYANDPRLLDWVHATATFGFSEAYHVYVRDLSRAEKDTAFAEAVLSARLYGATQPPQSWSEWENLLRDTSPVLVESDIIAEFIDIMSEAPILPGYLRWLQRLLVRAAIEIVPEPVRSLSQLKGKGLRSGEKRLVKILAWIAGNLPLGNTLHRQAARRLRLLR